MTASSLRYPPDMRYLTLFALLLVSSLVWAQVYKWVDADGGVHYSDEPHPGAESIELPEISIYRFDVPEWKTVPKSPPAPPAQQDSSSPQRVPYGSFQFAQPPNNYRVEGAEAWLQVELRLDPPLQADDRIQVYLDGHLYMDQLARTQLQVSGFDPGSHILEARVVDTAGTSLIRAKSLLFHYQPE